MKDDEKWRNFGRENEVVAKEEWEYEKERSNNIKKIVHEFNASKNSKPTWTNIEFMKNNDSFLCFFFLSFCYIFTFCCLYIN